MDEFEPESLKYLEKGFDSLADSSNLKQFWNRNKI